MCTSCKREDVLYLRQDANLAPHFSCLVCGCVLKFCLSYPQAIYVHIHYITACSYVCTWPPVAVDFAVYIRPTDRWRWILGKTNELGGPPISYTPGVYLCGEAVKRTLVNTPKFLWTCYHLVQKVCTWGRMLLPLFLSSLWLCITILPTHPQAIYVHIHYITACSYMYCRWGKFCC